MGWSCPNLTTDERCSRREKECEPCAEGCILAEKYQIAGRESRPLKNKFSGEDNTDTENKGTASK